jgi:hypothetical protein
MDDRVCMCIVCSKTDIESNMIKLEKGEQYHGADEPDMFLCHTCAIGIETAKVSAEQAMHTTSVQEGTKYDADKLRCDLVPPELFLLDSAVYTMGAEKYEDNNWKKGLQYSRLIGATLRHLLARVTNEVYDSESGLPHLAHARWCLGALLYYDLYDYEEFDDIPEDTHEFIVGLLNQQYPWRKEQTNGYKQDPNKGCHTKENE